MRQIKFRAWDTKTNTMWQRAGIDAHGNYCYAEKHPHGGSSMKQFDDLHITEYDIYYPDDIILMQFTGLLDKNGKEIYEGDILKDDVNDILEVKFGKLPLDKSGDCVCTYEAFYCKNYGKLGQAPSHECQNIGHWMEIIGNIYENPELLK